MPDLSSVPAFLHAQTRVPSPVQQRRGPVSPPSGLTAVGSSPCPLCVGESRKDPRPVLWTVGYSVDLLLEPPALDESALVFHRRAEQSVAVGRVLHTEHTGENTHDKSGTVASLHLEILCFT